MLANAFARKLRAKYMAEGEAKGEAKGEARGEAKGLSAVEEAARRQGMDLEDIRRVIEERNRPERARVGKADILESTQIRACGLNCRRPETSARRGATIPRSLHGIVHLYYYALMTGFHQQTDRLRSRRTYVGRGQGPVSHFVTRRSASDRTGET